MNSQQHNCPKKSELKHCYEFLLKNPLKSARELDYNTTQRKTKQIIYELYFGQIYYYFLIEKRKRTIRIVTKV